MRILIGIIVLFLLAGSSLGSSGVGTASFNFLKIGVGARPLAMGGAFTAMADDATSIYWNPAGLTKITGSEAAVGYVKYMAGINSGFAGYARKLGEKSNIGVSVNSFFVGGLTKTDENNKDLGTFGSSILVPTVAYATRLGETVSAGAAAKFIYQTIDTYNSYGIALDMGAVYAPANARYEVGFVAQNVGQQMKAFISEKDLPPVTVKLGALYKHKEAPFRAGFDLGKSTDSDFFFSFGTEYWINQLLAARFGYYSMGQELHSDSDKDMLGGLSFGIGLKWRKYGFDYAFVPKVDFGYEHRVSLQVKM